MFTVRSVGKGRWEGREGIDGADRKDMKDAEDISPRITTKMSLKYSIFLDVIWLTYSLCFPGAQAPTPPGSSFAMTGCQGSADARSGG